MNLPLRHTKAGTAKSLAHVNTVAVVSLDRTAQLIERQRAADSAVRTYLTVEVEERGGMPRG